MAVKRFRYIKDHSKDDPLWIAIAELQDIPDLVASPVRWVRKNSGNRAVLKRPYVLDIQIDPNFTGDEDEILVQGISDTNLLTIRTAASAAAKIGKRFDLPLYRDKAKEGEYVSDEVARQKMLKFYSQKFVEMRMSYCPKEGKVYIHFPIWKKRWEKSLGKREPFIGFFLLEKAKGVDLLYELVGEVMERAGPSGREEHIVRYFEERDGEMKQVPRGEHTEPAVLRPPAARAVGVEMPPIPVLYSSDFLNSSSQDACENLVARYKAGDPTVTYEMAYSKSYATPPGGGLRHKERKKKPVRSGRS